MHKGLGTTLGQKRWHRPSHLLKISLLGHLPRPPSPPNPPNPPNPPTSMEKIAKRRKEARTRRDMSCSSQTKLFFRKKKKKRTYVAL